MKLEFSRQIFENSSNIKFNENPSSENRVVPCGRTDMMKLIFTFHTLANAPRKMINLAIHFFVAWDICEYSKSIRDRKLGFGCFSLPQHQDIPADS